MELSAILKAGVLNARGRDHASVLAELASALTRSGAASPASCALKSHESAEGALAGTGAAIFHCLSEEAASPMVAVATSRKGIPGPAAKEPVRIFFLIVSPIKESGTHLQLLSRTEALLNDRGLRDSLLSASSMEEAERALKHYEGSSKALYLPLEREEVLSELETSAEGLSDAEAARRLNLAGPNALKRVRRKGPLADLLQNLFLNLFAVLLWAGGAMAFVAGMPELGWAIFLVIVINAAFSFWQEYKAERAVEALLTLLPARVRAVRQGREASIDASMLVPGDLIILSEGDRVPADGRLIAADALRVDNSALTGEAKPVYKTAGPLENGRGFLWTEIPNMLFAGTSVVSGAGRLIVTATGMDTEIGRVAYLTQAIRSEASPLQREIGRLTRTVTFIATALGLAFFFLGYSIAGLTFAESFIFAIGIIVANVPEGLLPTVTLSLAMGVERMASKKAIVKKLSAVETLGSATVICTDKTGTLTTNRMCVREVFAAGASFDVTGEGYSPEGAFMQRGGAPSGAEGVVRDVLSIAALCSNARLVPPPAPGGEWTISGDSTEGALLTAAAKAGADLDALNERHPRVAHIPFERIRKRMTTVHQAGGLLGVTGRIALVKGSPREVLAISDEILSPEGREPLSEGQRSRILAENDRMASEGLRVLAMAFREVPELDAYAAESTETALVFAGLAAMMDPPRPEVKKAVEECRSAGIKIVMLTGDYGLTARAIADQAGIAPLARVITGEELKSTTDRELREVLKKEAIFARVAPTDKLRVAAALQENGETVAVTGDGVNDAPALKKADIGIAMGLRGSDVAKESAEIVLSDDNFASIVDAIREGRAVYSNIRKFVTYIFASNIPEVVPFIAFVLLKIPLPLTVLQILAVDLGTDVLPALGLGVEPPEPGIMKEPPRPRGARLLDRKTLLRAYLFLGPIEAALSLSAFFFVYWQAGWRPGGDMAEYASVYALATTMSFLGIVAAQAGNVFACRTERASVLGAGIFRNRFIMASLFAEAALAVALAYTPLNKVFGFAPPGAAEWAYIAFFPFIILGAEEARKAALRRMAAKRP